MAGQDQGSKTELPTTKKLRDARKKGDVPKVADVSLTLGFIFAILLLWLLISYTTEGFIGLLELAINSPGKPFDATISAVAQVGLRVFLGVSAMLIIPVAVFSLLVEFLVVGPVITSEKFKPKLSHLNPAEGLKRMFGADNLVELVKSIFKATLLAFAFYLTVSTLLSELILLPGAEEENVISAMWYLAIRILGWTSAAFLMIMFFDAIYQKYSFTKKMKMSIRDIRDELKETEGDPMLKGARKDLGQEWAQAAPAEAAAKANVLVVNPIHVGIAIVYDQEKTKIPIITAKGEEHVARAMRDAAANAGVPILRNEQLARALLADQTEGNYVPRALFNIVAEVIIWAQSVRDTGNPDAGITSPNKVPAPGEDLTNYHRVGW